MDITNPEHLRGLSIAYAIGQLGWGAPQVEFDRAIDHFYGLPAKTQAEIGEWLWTRPMPDRQWRR